MKTLDLGFDDFELGELFKAADVDGTDIAGILGCVTCHFLRSEIFSLMSPS